MTKYHKLEGSHESLIPVSLAESLAGDIPRANGMDTRNSGSGMDDDEEFALFVHNTHRHINAADATTTAGNANGHFHHHAILDARGGNDNMIIVAAADPDDGTMEVPLLNNNNKDYNNQHNHQQHSHHAHHQRQHEHHQRHQYHHNFDATECQFDLAGFGANLSNKSTQDAKFKILLAISLCGVFMIIEFLGGYFAGSLAIMADAAHLASDCIGFVISYVAISLGSRPPDRRMSFGYKRLEVMGALISILGIWILTATLVMVAVQRIFTNDYDLNANTMMTISAIGILINIVMIFVLHTSWFMPAGSHGHSHAHGHSHSHVGHGHSHSHHSPTPPLAAHVYTDVLPVAAGAAETPTDGSISMAVGNAVKQNGLSSYECDELDAPSTLHHHKEEKNVNLRASIIHVIGDLVQSIGVFLASVLIKFIPSAKISDPLCTMLFSVIVVMTTVGLFKESVLVIMDAVPKNISLDELEEDLAQIDGVKSVHHLNVWSHTTDYRVLMVHLVVDLLTDSNTVTRTAIRLASSNKYDIKHCTVQIERVTA